MGPELLSCLCSKKIIISYGDENKTILEEKLHKIFLSNTLILIPILNQHYELTSLIGISDRRKSLRISSIDIKNACSIITLLANQVKLEMFQKSTKNAELILNNILDNVNIDIYANDYYTHDMLYANKSMAEPYGGVANMMGKKCFEAIFTDKREPCMFCPQPRLIDKEGKPTKVYSWDYERPFDGNWFRVYSSCIPWTDGRLAHLVASVDITENKKNQIIIEKLAQFDYLTQLPNRRNLEDQIELFIKDEKIFASSFYVLFCDLDGFKKINDSIGHNAGDALLKAISQELKLFSEDEIRSYRFGGDEFVIIVKDEKSVDKFKMILNKLVYIFCDTYDFNEHKIKCGCSIGVSHYPTSAKTHQELFRLADIAMYSAKNAGTGTIRFSCGNSNLTFSDYFANHTKR